MAYSKRKPYLNLKESVISFFEAPVRYLKESNQIESAFEKPYLDMEYPSMHLKLPVPSWPDWFFASGAGGRGGARKADHCPACALYADPSFDCEADPVEIHSAIFCTWMPGAPQTIKWKDFSDLGEGIRSGTVIHNDCEIGAYAEEGEIREITIGAWASLGPSLAVFVNSAVEKHTICGEMIDGAGNYCDACVDVTCEPCDCDEEPTVAIDEDNSDDTIDNANPATVICTGGCAPYQWSVVGSGYSVAGSGTNVTVSVVAGDCGVDFDSYCTVSVEDNCSNSDSFVIKHTDAQYNTCCSYEIENWGSAQGCMSSCPSVTVTDGLNQYVITARDCFFGITPSCYEQEGNWACSGDHCPPSPYDDPCASGVGNVCTSGCSGGKYECWGEVTHKVWGCAP